MGPRFRGDDEPCAWPRRPRLQSTRYLDYFVDLELVALLHVVEVLQRQAALETSLDLAHIVLEALERVELAVEDDDVVTQQPDLGSAAHHPLEHVTAGDRADLRNLVNLAHLDHAELALLFLRCQHA